MLGLSYGQILVIIGATAAVIGPKDLPKIARIAGRIAGRAVGYVQMARGQLDNILPQSQTTQVHKELRDALAQLDAIRYEIRSISLINPDTLTRKLVGSTQSSITGGFLTSGTEAPSNIDNEVHVRETAKGLMSNETHPASLQSEAVTYSRLAESAAMASSSPDVELDGFQINAGSLNVLPVSAESSGMLPKREGAITGSDIMLEATLEADVADKARYFFSQPENQIRE